MPSCDMVSEIDLQEVDNAVNQAMKEIATRYDFKGSKSAVVLDRKALAITIDADDEMKLKQVQEMLKEKFAKRQVPVRAMQMEEPQKSGGSMLRQLVKLQQGIPQDKAKTIIAEVKKQFKKMQGQIQGDQVRFIDKDIDNLQAMMRYVKEMDLDIDVQFTNYRS